MRGPSASIAAVLVVASFAPGGIQQPPNAGSSAPIVAVVGCARRTDAPAIWDLTDAGEPSPSSRAGITSSEKAHLAAQAPGRRAYQLIGVADFVDADTARAIGDRGRILSRPRVNATGVLADGRRVGVKGLLIDASPARINLTSVVDLGACPARDRRQ
jgi:hypothetical protein